MPRILIADDHPLFRLALAQAVRELVPGAVVAEAESLDETRARLLDNPDTDLVLLDLHMPGSHGLMGLAALRGEFPTVAVVMISAHDDPAVIRRAMAYGAAGFIPKRAGLELMREGISAVLACEEWLPPDLRAEVRAAPIPPGDSELAGRLAGLTAQQLRVLRHVAEGRLNKQIAFELGVRERTVKAHMTAIFEKLNVRNRTQAGVMLRAMELRSPDRHES
jgi:DNA-binding NarL/FixJ family response regulator